jgi:mannitol 2-dehydrogenase
MAAIKLSDTSLPRLDAKVKRPTYDRSKIQQSMMHIGVGGFHRAHRAYYTDELLEQGNDPAWGYCGVGLLPFDAPMRDVMREQDCLYTLVERSRAGDHARVIGSIVNFRFAPDDPQALIEQMASPQTRLVSMTITESGYYIHQGTGEFDEKHPDIQHDHDRAHRRSR